MKPDKRDRLERLKRPDRPESGSGPDPYGLAASSRCVIELPAHSEKGPSKRSCYSGAGYVAAKFHSSYYIY